MEAVAVKSRSNSKAIALTMAKSLAIVISVTAIYMALCYINLPLAKSSFQGVIFGKTFRMASALRGLFLVSPSANFGVQLGGFLMNQTGPLRFSLGYMFMPFLGYLAGWAAYMSSKKWGRSFAKDFIVLALLGLVMGVLVTLNLSTLAAFVPGAMLKSILSAAAFSKIASNVIITSVGGLLVLGVYDNTKAAIEGFKNKRK